VPATTRKGRASLVDNVRVALRGYLNGSLLCDLHASAPSRTPDRYERIANWMEVPEHRFEQTKRGYRVMQ